MPTYYPYDIFCCHTPQVYEAKLTGRLWAVSAYITAIQNEMAKFSVHDCENLIRCLTLFVLGCIYGFALRHQILKSRISIFWDSRHALENICFFIVVFKKPLKTTSTRTCSNQGARLLCFQEDGTLTLTIMPTEVRDKCIEEHSSLSVRKTWTRLQNMNFRRSQPVPSRALNTGLHDFRNTFFQISFYCKIFTLALYISVSSFPSACTTSWPRATVRNSLGNWGERGHPHTEIVIHVLQNGSFRYVKRVIEHLTELVWSSVFCVELSHFYWKLRFFHRFYNAL